MKDMIYKVNNRAIFKNVDYIIFITIAYALIVLYYKDYKVAYTINAFTLFYLIPLIIVILLFLDYYLHTKGQKVYFSDENIVVKTVKGEKKYEKSDIEKVTIYAAPSFRRNSTFRLLPFEAFHFVEIKMNSGKGVIYITSLSDSELYYSIQQQSILKGKIYYKKGLFNSIFWSRL